MSRSRWMCLAAWLLLFLIIFCVWSKLGDVTEAMQGKKTAATAMQEEKAPVMPIQEVKHEEAAVPVQEVAKEAEEPAAPAAVALLDSTINIAKDGETITVSGLFANDSEVDSTIDRFKMFNGDVQKMDIQIKENVDKAKWLGIVQNLAHPFSTNFETGSIAYQNNTLTVKGEVLSDDIKNEIDQIANRYNFNEIAIDNQTTVVEAATDLQKARKALYELLRLKVVEFESAKGVITPSGKAVLDEIADTLNRYQSLNIVIEGHTDSDGDEAANLALSTERADAVKAYLIEKGVIEGSMTTEGFGETKPIVENTTAENKQKNRRVEFKIKGE